MISEKHPNFIVNISNATANDVKNLIKLAKEGFRKFKIKLEERSGDTGVKFLILSEVKVIHSCK